MTIQQISVFLENREGNLAEISTISLTPSTTAVCV